MIRAVIFDFDSTLVDYYKSDRNGIYALTSILPIKVDPNDFWEKSGDILVDIYKDGIVGSDVHYERIKRTIAAYGIAWKADYVTTYLESYLAEVFVYDGVFRLMKYLKEKVKIGLLTNASDPMEQRKRIKASGLKDFFDAISISEETKKYKPDKEAFEEILDKLSVKNREAIYVGDSEKYDIEGAKNAGLLAFKKGSVVLQTKADYVFTEYEDLIGVLKYKYYI
jgi:HAD superfamily hydrolase (TIGR01549 family)